MSDPAHILVTGATGTVGGHVAAGLAERGVDARAATRRPAGVDLPLPPVRFDFEDPSTYDAFDGVDRLFLVRPPAIANVWASIVPALDAAERAGVEHVVFLSLLGAEQNPVVPHRWIEWALLRSGMAWTFLRPSFFMQNLATTHRADLRDRNTILVPAGQGRTSFVDARDVAAAGVRALVEPGHHNAAYALTGAEALTYFEVAAIFSDVLGREVRYANPSVLAFVRHMRRQGHPWPFVLVMTGIYLTARFGLAGTVTDDLERLLGRPPTSMRTFVQDYRACWRPDRGGEDGVGGLPPGH
jgi:uncharacterized protein YbjT (DUF2867 family)